MGRRGPPPKSAEVLRLTGNPGHRAKSRLEGDTFNPPLALAPAPPHLSKAEKAEYNRVGRLLLERGTVALCDRGLLSMLATATVRHEEAERELAAMGSDRWVDSATGRLHPLLKVSDQAARQALRLAKLFGLTPASRSGVTPSAPPEPGGGKPAGAGWDQFNAEGTQR